MKYALICALLVIISLYAYGDPATPASGITPNPQVQNILNSLLPQGESTVLNVASEEELQQKLQELQAYAKGDHREILRQIFFFRLSANDRRAAMVAGLIIKHVGVRKDDIALGLIPVLDAGDGRAVKTAENWLGEVHSCGTNAVDFSTYSQLLKDKRQSITPGFVRYLYHTSAQDGLALLARNALSDGEAASVISKAKSQTAADLAQLADKGLWWLDLFVADQIARSPEKRTPTLMQRLDASTHPAVQESLKAINSPGTR